MAFRGRYDHNLDQKDRLTVPARFRAALSDGAVLVAGLDPCVEVYPAEAFETFTEKFLSPLNPLGAEGRKLGRHFHGSSFDSDLDSAGRIRVPGHLVEYAGLEGGCVVMGMSDHFEVWNPERWATYAEEMRSTVVQAAENLASQSDPAT